MSTSIVDKENSTGLYHAHTNSSRKFGDSLGGANFNKAGFATPQHKLHTNLKLQEGSKTEKRRALGDLLNTTKATNRQSLAFNNCATPKSSLKLKFGTPKIDSMKKLTDDFSKQSLGSSLKSNRNIDQESNYPPVEHCIPSGPDTFQDLFEDGKISDIFLDNNMTFVPRLPANCIAIDKVSDVFNDFEIFMDKGFDDEVKKMNKSIKTQQKKQLNDCLDIQEVPSLDLPTIHESLDLSSSDSFVFDD
jgi:hypothetical protein